MARRAELRDANDGVCRLIHEGVEQSPLIRDQQWPRFIAVDADASPPPKTTFWKRSRLLIRLSLQLMFVSHQIRQL